MPKHVPYRNECLCSHRTVPEGLFIIAKTGKISHIAPVPEWIKNCDACIQWSTIKKNKLLIHITTWMNLKCILPSERGHTKRPTYCMVPFIWPSGKHKTRRAENKSVVSRDWEWGKEFTTKTVMEKLLVMKLFCLVLEWRGMTLYSSKPIELYSIKVNFLYVN